MKKIYSFIALMLMCFAGTANAQKDWTPVGGEETNVEAIVPGEDHFYVLKGGSNTNAEGGPGKDVDGTTKYLSAGEKSGDITDAAVFHFIENGVKNVDGEEFQIYVLKNYSNGKYLSSEKERYVDTKAKAFNFTVRKAVLVDESSLGEGAPWIEYSNAASATRSQEAENLGAWVLCKAQDEVYKMSDAPGVFMCFYGNPAFAGWIDTNNWLIAEVEGTEQSAEDKYTAVYDKYFTAEFDPESYIVGDQPGCVSAEFAAHIKDVYDRATNIIGAGDDASYKAMADEIVKLFEEELPANVIPVAPGYYVLKNMGQRGFLTVFDNGKGRGNSALATKNVVEGTDYLSWTPESTLSWNIDNAKYIWKLEKSTEDGKLFFQNFGTGKYLATDADYQTVEKENAVPFKVSNQIGQEFVITFGSNGMVHVANHSDNKLLNYNDPNDAASRWMFYTINNEIIDSLSTKVAQDALNKELKATIDQANEDYYANQFENYVPGDLYKDTLDAGLVDSVLEANASAGDSEKGSALNHLFDSDMNTYYHTAWKAEEVAEVSGTNWIKVDLGKAVSKLKVKFTKRQKAANGHVSEYALYTPEDGNPETADWNKLVAESADSIEFAYGKNNTHIAEYTFTEPVRYIRFDVEQTRGRDSATWNKKAGESGPFWHMSELRFYDPADIKDNPAFNEVPAEVKDALLASIKKGEAELAENKATKATIDEIDANLKKFWEAYPDASGLKRDLENALAMTEFATEMEEPSMGFYPIGSIKALQDVVNEISKNVKAVEDSGKALTLKQIEGFTAQLDKAVADFNAKLVKPIAGKLYFIVGKSTVENQDAPQVDGCVVSVDADVKNGTPVIRYKHGAEDLSQRFNALWLAEEVEGGMAFKNLANGLYMNNVYDGLTKEEIDSLELPNNQIGYSKTPKAFQLESFSKEGYKEYGYFVMTLMKGQYLNFQEAGKVMVHYSERNDNNAPLTFVEAVDEEGISFDGTYFLDVEPGKVQILSYPVAFESVESSDLDFSGAYEVVGRNGDNIMLNPIDGVIEAGTPFIIKTRAAESAEDALEAGLASASLQAIDIDAAQALTYNYNVVSKNGLVSAPQRIELGEGFGVIVNGTVIPSEAGNAVAAGKGFFNKDIPTTAESTDFMIPVEGVISGEGDATAVENVEIVKNVASDVYTVAGVKVRSNVKISNATQGLPKGVYIVAGKKVIVK